jgi:hypothetical protein
MYKYFISTLFPSTFNLDFSVRARHKVWHPFKTAGKIIAVYILIFTFIGRRYQEMNGNKPTNKKSKLKGQGLTFR